MAMYMFANKMMALTNLRTSTDISIKKLSKDQIKLIENTTRYCSMLDIGILGSFISATLIVAFGYLFRYEWNMGFFQIAAIIMCFDFIIKVTTGYLQFSFAIKYYDKYCVLPHRCWRFMLTQQATRSLTKRYQQIENSKTDMDDEEHQSIQQQITPLKTNDLSNT